MNKVSDFLKSGLGLLIMGFILTTVCGGIINSCHSGATWKRDKNFELFKVQVAKHDTLLTDLSNAMGARTFRLHRVFWNLDDPGLEPQGEMWNLDERAKDEIKNGTRWTDYYKTVVDWNLSYRDFTRRIQLLAKNKKLATEFFEPGERGAQTAKEGCILALFEGLHTKVRRLHEEARKSATVNRAKHAEIQAEIQLLYNKVDDYMARLSEDFETQDKSGNPLELGHSKD